MELLWRGDRVGYTFARVLYGWKWHRTAVYVRERLERQVRTRRDLIVWHMLFSSTLESMNAHASASVAGLFAGFLIALAFLSSACVLAYVVAGRVLVWGNLLRDPVFIQLACACAVCDTMGLVLLGRAAHIEQTFDAAVAALEEKGTGARRLFQLLCLERARAQDADASDEDELRACDAEFADAALFPVLLHHWRARFKGITFSSPVFRCLPGLVTVEIGARLHNRLWGLVFAQGLSFGLYFVWTHWQ